MKMPLPANVTDLISKLEENGYECYVVGGAVRSFLLGLPIHDYDLTTNAEPKEMQQVFHAYKTIETGLKHGTLTVVSGGQPIEITTYRKDGAYSDHRHPEQVTFSKAVEEDCARRDFTVNALCYNPSCGILDFFGGIEDLDHKVLRCIGIAENRFDEDALRILRAIRFAAVLGFTIEEKTSKALLNSCGLLKYISTERIKNELDGFFAARKCAPYMDTYKDIFFTVIPDSAKITDEQWQSVLQAIDRTDQPLLRMAVMLTFITKDAHTVLKEMKYSNREINDIENLLACRDIQLETHEDVRRLVRDLSVPFADYISYRKAVDDSFDPAYAQKEYELIEAKHECCKRSDMAVDGNDLKDLGFEGHDIAAVLEYLLDGIIEDRIPNEKQALLKEAEAYQKTVAA